MSSGWSGCSSYSNIDNSKSSSITA